MAEPFLSEIRLMSFVFPPKGWALCNGQLLPINQNQALFSLLGTTYGGDGRVNFGLPNLQGNTPIHMGNGHTLGERGGQQTHTLTQQEMPQHVHTAMAANAPPTASAPSTARVLSKAAGANFYGSASDLVATAGTAIGTSGSSLAHENMQPYLVLNFSIALQGIFPSQT
jgi:microcystin-dependent protein